MALQKIINIILPQRNENVSIPPCAPRQNLIISYS